MRILILSAHADDAEIGMGGTIAKLLESEENIIQMVAFSSSDNSLPEGFPEGTLKHESHEAARQLGFDVRDMKPAILDFQTRWFSRDRQEILEQITLFRLFGPEVVYCPSYNDMHQDHEVLAKETIRAFKTSSTILMYQMPWNARSFKLQYFSVLEERHIRKKTKALEQFKSQQAKRYMRHASIISSARFVGSAIDVQYAEAFEVVRYID